MKKTALKTPSERFLAETARFELACRCRQTDFEFYKVRVRISQFRGSF